MRNHSIHQSILAATVTLTLLMASSAIAGNGANLVLYNYHTPAAGEKEIAIMSDLAQDATGSRYTAQMVEVEFGITDQLTTSFMFEGQATSGQGNYLFTGFRWENRYRLFDEGTTLNPVLYLEYEDLSFDTKYIMEIGGRSDAAATTTTRPRERVLETRLILSQDLSNQLDLSFNWINESNLDTGITAFGYATGINYAIMDDTLLGLELFGGLGDSNKGVTTRGSITQHYLGTNFRFGITDTWKMKLGGAIGLTNISQDMVRFAFSREF